LRLFDESTIGLFVYILEQAASHGLEQFSQCDVADLSTSEHVESVRIRTEKKNFLYGLNLYSWLIQWLIQQLLSCTKKDIVHSCQPSKFLNHELTKPTQPNYFVRNTSSIYLFLRAI
jgi:hypothetical protein